MSTLDLFAQARVGDREPLGREACILRGFALDRQDALLAAIAQVTAVAPPRHMVTPGGFTMSAALSNCGALGWVSDARGYRYAARDPGRDQPWPAMPAVFLGLARDAAREAGFPGFTPDACLINHYAPGAKMSLHQDRDEHDLGAPIVSVSLGMEAVFLFGGHVRADRPRRVPLYHGDVAVWGGEDRLRFHGIAPLKDAPHPRLGPLRINLTLRKAG
ncbi:Alkylated DNA repair protein AlkB [plant metagenome]